VFVVLAVTALLCLGVRESARANTIMVFTNPAVVVLFIVLAFTGFKSGNLKPFAPNGFDGVVTAASLIFFAYIGFDAISTSGEETKNPGRDLPIAIIGSLAVCTLLYILVAISAVGALPFKEIAGKDAPLAELMRSLNFDWAATLISFGGAALAIFLMKYLEAATWIRFGAWLALGLVVYFAYGVRHSLLRQGRVENPEAEI
jgi:basic amino acid/polyamine antiporter, APA family